MFPKDSCILIADDSPAVVVLIKQQLAALGYKNLLDAENGKMVLEKMDVMQYAGTVVNLLIVDWNMPEMSGIELLQTLKNHPTYKDIPFLMITVESETEKVIKAIVLGVSDFIVKPFGEQVLADKMAAIWRRINQPIQL